MKCSKFSLPANYEQSLPSTTLLGPLLVNLTVKRGKTPIVSDHCCSKCGLKIGTGLPVVYLQQMKGRVEEFFWRFDITLVSKCMVIEQGGD